LVISGIAGLAVLGVALQMNTRINDFNNNLNNRINDLNSSVDNYSGLQSSVSSVCSAVSSKNLYNCWEKHLL